ncbi:MAG TPA: hypothetical protein PLU71_04985 [Candidatus Dependentiae bacterium]|nr:hypothetical protein [Candidatus Dependentiae bacterium]HRQ63190.1 hypothetical protein [Candidatus Dependentiae bacterium]
MKHIFAIIIACIGLHTAHAMEDLPPIIKGDIQIRNNLSQVVTYILTYQIHGRDKESGVSFKNNHIGTRGEIGAQSIKLLRSSMQIGKQSIWSTPIVLHFASDSYQPITFQIIEDPLGTYTITSSKTGQLEFCKENTED